MRLSLAVRRYVESKHLLGIVFKTGVERLRSFVRLTGNIPLRSVTQTHTEKFLSGPRTSEATWSSKHSSLKWFFKYWILRGELENMPLPRARSFRRDILPPRIFTKQELRQLLATVSDVDRLSGCLLDADTVRTFVIFVYGTGARLGEGLAMLRSAVDLNTGLLTLRYPGNQRWRTIPIEGRVLTELRRYERSAFLQFPDRKTFFVSKTGLPVTSQVMMRRFDRLCSLARISRTPGAYFRPRMYDLRHSFAVHALNSWLKQGKNLRSMLPTLSAYLGHTKWETAEKYLAMVPKRFRRHLMSLETSMCH
jgi:integrase/recombinase XerD